MDSVGIESARARIGARWETLATPALLLDLGAARRNIERMSAEADAAGLKLRPHAKAHKSAELARLQLDAGAVGVTVATVWEALALARAGIPDVLVANEIVGSAKLEALAEACSLARITVAADDAGNVRDLAKLSGAAGHRLAVAVEVDIGMGRGGTRTAEAAVELSERIDEHPSLEFAGVVAYEGHLVTEPDRERRARGAERAFARLATAVEAIGSAGYSCAIVSAGGTATFELAARYERLTDVQVGSYVLMDSFHEQLTPGRFEQALLVAATVVSRQGATVVLDAGRKSVGHELAPSQVLGHDVSPRTFAEEHAVFDFASAPTLEPGATALLVPGYAPTTVNLHEHLHVIEDGVVTDVWSVLARGPFALS